MLETNNNFSTKHQKHKNKNSILRIIVSCILLASAQYIAAAGIIQPARARRVICSAAVSYCFQQFLTYQLF